MLHIFITVTLCLKVYRGEGALLHQTPAQQFAAAGDLVETFCSSSACVVDTDLLRWFMKKDSEVIALNTSCKAGPGCRVTTRRASNGDCGLTIRGVQPVDAGVYYCAEYSSNALEFSNGSLLTVRDNSTQNTTVTVMGPSVSGSALDSKGTDIRVSGPGSLLARAPGPVVLLRSPRRGRRSKLLDRRAERRRRRELQRHELAGNPGGDMAERCGVRLCSATELKHRHPQQGYFIPRIQ